MSATLIIFDWSGISSARRRFGVALAVEALVVRARDDRDAAELLSPRDLREELERVGHVAADLVDLAVVERARATESEMTSRAEQRVRVAVAST
jgi:hypothetical protein